MSAPAATSAVGKSISFRPFELYTRAETYGIDQKPQLNVSQVVCLALDEFFERRGITADSLSAHAELLAKVGAAVKSQPSLGQEIETLIKRGLRAGRKAA